MVSILFFLLKDSEVEQKAVTKKRVTIDLNQIETKPIKPIKPSFASQRTPSPPPTPQKVVPISKPKLSKSNSLISHKKSYKAPKKTKSIKKKVSKTEKVVEKRREKSRIKKVKIKERKAKNIVKKKVIKVTKAKKVKSKPKKITKVVKKSKQKQKQKKRITSKSKSNLKHKTKSKTKISKKAKSKSKPKSKSKYSKKVVKRRDRTSRNFIQKMRYYRPQGPDSSLINSLYGSSYSRMSSLQRRFIDNNLRKILLISQQTLNYLGYPREASMMGQYGTNIVEFWLYPNGDIKGLRLKKRIGASSLDRQTIEVIKTAYMNYPHPPVKTKIIIYVKYQLF